MYSAVVLAGGTGRRMHQKLPKQFLSIGGKPIILHTLERLEKLIGVDEVVVVCHPRYRELLKMHIEAYMLKKPYIIIDGEKTRQESAHAGVLTAKNDHILLHEAARPFVTCQDFANLLQDEASSVTYGISIPFTVLQREGDYISGLLDRSSLLNIQLPQKALRTQLLYAYGQAEKEGRGFTEDMSMLIHYTHEPVKVLEGTESNIKITNSTDLMIGEDIYWKYIVGRD